MGSNGTWTLVGLIKAFIDLIVAYLLLWGSVFVFFASRLLSLFGLCCPCPRNVLIGYRNRSLSWHKLLVELSVEKIHHVKILAQSRFPFYMMRNGTKFRESEGEACSSSPPTVTSSSSYSKNRENGFDAKGKRIMNQKRKSGFRWRRRAALRYAKACSASSFDDSPLVSAASGRSSNGSQIKSDIGPSWAPAGPRDDDHRGDRSQCSFQLSSSFADSESIDKDSFCWTIKTRNEDGTLGDEREIIIMLEEALEQEKAARADLYSELEKERAAAATAAEQAMALILRLQEDKASLAMEARQYQRFTEEKIAYEEEEMGTLKEMLLMKDIENYSLERKLEAFRQMSRNHNEQLEVNPSLRIRKEKEQNNNPATTKHNSILDKESVVYDVYTVDEKTELLEGRAKECESTSSTASD